MSEESPWGDYVETRGVRDYAEVASAVAEFRREGVLIADFREANPIDRGRIADFLAGAALAHGNSPHRLADGVLFLAKDRDPTKAETRRFRESPDPPLAG